MAKLFAGGAVVSPRLGLVNPADLPDAVVRAVRCAVEAGELAAGVAVPERVVVERTRPGGVGDYATPVAFQLAKGDRDGRSPRDVAGLIARRLRSEDGVERVEVTGGGFLCFGLAPLSAPRVIRELRVRELGVGGLGARDLGPDMGIPDMGEPGIRDPKSPAPSALATPSAPTADQAEVEAKAATEADVGVGAGAGVGAPPAADPPAPLRTRVLHEVLARLAPARPGPVAAAPVATAAPAAPVAQRDGDVVARFGEGAARWAMLCVPARETPVFSDRLLVQGEENEFFRVRYAHARSRALLRNAADLGFAPEPGEVEAPALLRALAEHRLVLEAAGHHRAPERLTRHLVELADALLDFQYRVLPRGDEKPSAAHRARLAVAEAAGAVLAGGLALLGIDAPTRL